MAHFSKEFKVEILSAIAALLAALLLSNVSKRNKRSWFGSIFTGRRSIDNIYKLLPILQKNAKILFLIFNDFATAINSIPGSIPDELDSYISRDTIRSILMQEYFQNKLVDAQIAVLNEFNVDQYELNDAIERFSQDDQVQMYVTGVELMYNVVLDRGYPQCPGVEICEQVSKQTILKVLERIAVSKIDHMRKSGGNIDTKSIESNIIHDEMQKFGYSDPLDSLVAFRNIENYHHCDSDFTREKQKIVEKYDPKKFREVIDIIQKMTSEEVKAMLETMDATVPMYLVIFKDEIVTEFFTSLLKCSEKIPNAILVWMFECEQTDYTCSKYPAVVLLRSGKVERIYYNHSELLRDCY